MATPDVVEAPDDDSDDSDGSEESAEFGDIGSPTGRDLANALDTDDNEDESEPQPDIGAADAESTTPDPDEVDVADATIEESDIDDSALFSGEEDKSEPEPDADDEPDFEDFAGEVDGEEPPGLAGPSSNQIEQAINEGAARLAVVGLDDADQSSLETEMNDVFEAFRLGFFGSRAVEEHILSNQEDVDPLWGFVGSALVCGAFSLHMRPDGDEQLANIRRGLGLSDDDEEDDA